MKHSNCICKAEQKIPEKEFDFYKNQIFKQNLLPTETQYITPMIDLNESKKYDALARKTEEKSKKKQQTDARWNDYLKSKVKASTSCYIPDDDNYELEIAHNNESSPELSVEIPKMRYANTIGKLHSLVVGRS